MQRCDGPAHQQGTGDVPGVLILLTLDAAL